jgi:hypothetical protein
MERNHFTFFKSFQETANKLPENERLKFYEAIINMSLTGEEPQLDGISEIIWPFIRDVIVHCRKKAMNGSKDAIQKQNESKTKANQKQNESEIKTNRELKKKKKEEEEEEDLLIIEEKINKEEEKEKKEEKGWRNNNKHLAWFKTCTKEQLIQKVTPYRQQYPDEFLREFITYYSQEHQDGGMNINNLTMFDLESKLRKWWNDPKSREKYNKPQYRKL